MNNGMDNGAHFIDHPAVRTAWANIDVGNGRQATITQPGSFLITPELDFSLVSVHTLARLGVVGYNRFKPTSNLIGYIVSPSGRDVLAIGFVRLEVELRVPVNVHSVALFNSLVCFIVYREPQVPADGLFSMGRCSLLCCYGWNQIPVPHNASLPLHVPLPLQQQQQQQLLQQQPQQLQQQLEQQHTNGNINASINANTNTDSDSNNVIDTPPTATASSTANNNYGRASDWAYMNAEPGNGTSSR